MEKEYHMGKALTIFLILFFLIAFLQFFGIINIQGLLNPDSPHYLKWWEVWQPEKKDVPFIPGPVCPKTTCEITKPCCGYNGTGINDPSVVAIPIPASCPCPEDTNPTPIGRDNIAPGGPYNICECKKN